MVHLSSMPARITAPELHTRYGWVHGGPHTLADFRSQFVLLDFWTLGCINCHHILPDLRKLEEEFPRELVVLGIHSAKFTSEQETRSIRKAILKFGIQHPVLNDADMAVWEQYAVRAWPTTILIDPEGKIIGQHSGEKVYETIKPHLEAGIEEFKDRIKPSMAPYTKPEDDSGVLRFPTKLLPGPKNTLFIADTGHHTIYNLRHDGRIEFKAGQGSPGFRDGDLLTAQFHDPQGMAWWGSELLIADTGNHAIRSVDFRNGQVTTLAGNQTLGYYWNEDQWNTPVLPNSPWDLTVVGNELFVANAGNHQILRMDLAGDRQLYRWAGTGNEALHDGPRQEACFNQPSGITHDDMYLYIADAEASAIRRIHLLTGEVDTLVGEGLFTFGDEDGIAKSALLQHPIGVHVHQRNLYIADTYNGKVKVLNLDSGRVKTLAGGFDEPNDVLVHGDHLFLTNTHQHRLMRIHLTNYNSEILPIFA